jgi:hypothetical protein
MRRHFQAEEFEDGGSDVHDGRAFCIYFLTAKKYSGNDPWVDTMVSTPGLGIVFKDCVVDFTGD